MTPAEFERIAIRLFGINWLQACCDTFGFNSRMTPWRFANGKRPISVPLAIAMRALDGAFEMGPKAWHNIKLRVASERSRPPAWHDLAFLRPHRTRAVRLRTGAELRQERREKRAAEPK